VICLDTSVALAQLLSEDEVESADFAQREYEATPDQVVALQKAVDDRYHRLKRSGKLTTVSVDELKKLLEETSRSSSASSEA